MSGWIDYYRTDKKDGVGHVAIATGDGTIIHAAGGKSGIIESSIPHFVKEGKFRGARRYIPKDEIVLTLETPVHRGVEIEDDLRWIVLQSLPRS